MAGKKTGVFPGFPLVLLRAVLDYTGFRLPVDTVQRLAKHTIHASLRSIYFGH